MQVASQTETPMTHRAVLVVEDEALIRWSLRERLKEAGLSVVEAANGTVALDKIAHNGICAALLDLRLPDMNGLDILEEFRKQHPDAPVWIMTAYGTAAAEARAEKLGVTEFLNKPFDIKELVEKVVATLESEAE
jgi:DNA-binding NtrC family response regulator